MCIKQTCSSNCKVLVLLQLVQRFFIYMHASNLLSGTLYRNIYGAPTYLITSLLSHP